MTAAEIMAAVDAGQIVRWVNAGYRVIRDCLGQYLVVHDRSQTCWGLTNRAGDALNGLESQFFVEGAV